MSLGLALPSRPRAVRVIGPQATAPDRATAGGDCMHPAAAAPWSADLDRFVRDKPADAGAVLEHWLMPRGPKSGAACHGRD